MRWIFLLLLTANLGGLLWYTQIGFHQEKIKYPAPAKDVKQLVLLSETQAQIEKEKALQETASEPLVVAEDENKLVLPEIEIIDAKPVVSLVEAEEFVACYTVGPFKEDARLKDAKKQFGSLGVSIQQRSNIETELYGYRVYIPPQASHEDAVAVTKKLVSHNIDDYFIIQEEEKRNAISLGLFRKKSGAIRRMAQIRRFGLKPAMEVRNREREIYWLDIEQKENLLTEAAWREISEGQLELQRLQRDCAG